MSGTAAPTWSAWIGCYATWIVVALCAGWTSAQLLPLALEISLAFGANAWVGRAARQLTLPIIGIVWLIAIFWSEHALRQAVLHRRLRATALRIGGVLAVMAAGVALVRAIIVG